LGLRLASWAPKSAAQLTRTGHSPFQVSARVGRGCNGVTDGENAIIGAVIATRQSGATELGAQQFVETVAPGAGSSRVQLSA
jgi:hypothetical protein